MFLATFLIMLREGLEAVLIVSIILGYLKKTGNFSWAKYVYFGIFIALVLCGGAGVFLYWSIGELPQKVQEFYEGLVAIIAVFVLSYMIFWMKKESKTLGTSLTNKIDLAVGKSRYQGIILVGMVFFAVSREGLESVFFLFSFFEQDVSPVIPLLGSLSGLLGAVIIGVLLYKGSIRLNLGKFFRYTGIFILLIAAGMAASILAKFHEAGIWNHFQRIVYDVSDTMLSQNHILGSILSGLFGFSDSPTVGEVSLYFLYLIPALIYFLYPTSPNRQK